ncbi:Permease of the drug/metabolite transporter (DMT) superfamily [Clostridium sp. DSM 8431]|uniref:DMT family transporter n=1 Tax=Clostridium sp. DSM 8431 TaxID=1761781 RepID=UPI0008E83F34|nr:DMT family transporter [Clostridium sp. DSM 8431]SFU35257.1 Permease of the drug/metabolite transporter (DMT) superfamily [Clostridium sp. DSM 8431]
MNSKIKGNIMLIITALIWGNGFVAQSVGMNYIGPYTFLCVRGIIGGIFLIPCIFILNKFNLIDDSKVKGNKKELIIGGILCGVVVCIANIFQQLGLLYTSVGKSGFITALYIIIVPLLGVFIKKKVQKKIWLCAFIALIGLYLLSINGEMAINKGDILSLICAFFFSIQIMLVDHYTPLVNGVKLSCIQFLVSGIISAIPMFIFEKPSVSGILAAYIPLLYAGIISFGVAYTFQIIGQKYTDAASASLLMSLESVFAVLGGWMILGQTLSFKEIMGAAIMFLAIILAQAPLKFFLNK